MARTSRHGSPYKPVTDFSGSRSSAHTPEAREDRYMRLKKRSILLILIAICSAVAYLALIFIGRLAMPSGADVVIQVVYTIVLALSLFVAVGGAFAALIVRLVAALKR